MAQIHPLVLQALGLVHGEDLHGVIAAQRRRSRIRPFLQLTKAREKALYMGAATVVILGHGEKLIHIGRGLLTALPVGVAAKAAFLHEVQQKFIGGELFRPFGEKFLYGVHSLFNFFSAGFPLHDVKDVLLIRPDKRRAQKGRGKLASRLRLHGQDQVPHFPRREKAFGTAIHIADAVVAKDLLVNFHVLFSPEQQGPGFGGMLLNVLHNPEGFFFYGILRIVFPGKVHALQGPVPLPVAGNGLIVGNFFRKQIADGRHQILVGAVIIHESHGLRALGEHVAAKGVAYGHIGAAEGVDGLLSVADDEKLPLASQGFQHANLQGVRVLKFVHENVVVAAGNFPRFQKRRGPLQEIAEIQNAYGALFVPVGLVEEVKGAAEGLDKGAVLLLFL